MESTICSLRIGVFGDPKMSTALLYRLTRRRIQS